MRLQFSDEDEKFRIVVREFFDEEYPADIKTKLASGASLNKQDFQRSEQALASKGWSAPSWPKQYGGPGWTQAQRYIFDEELERAGAANVTPMGLLYFGPVLYTFGTAAQKQRWLPDILNSRTFWAQGYSEPGSGSDLASLQCKAKLAGDNYIVTGEKVWTTRAQFADWIFCLVRTDNTGKKHEGISFLCIDMKTPGVDVHPIISIDGKHELNRVTFDNVPVPVENRIGEEGQGWHYATYLLAYERTSYAHIGEKKQQIKALKTLAKNLGASGQSLLEDPLFAAKLARVEVAVQTLEFTTLRILSDTPEGEAPGDKASILKIMATEVAQQISTLYLDLAGQHALSKFDDSVTPEWAVQAGVPASASSGTATYFYDRSQSIYGGSNEVQRNIIAKRVLGL